MNFQIGTPSGSEIAAATDDNIDVLVDLEDGRRYAATFFTVDNLRTIMKRHRDSGECAEGTYIWAVDMIVVESISVDVIRRTVADLIATGEIESCCCRIR
ncbi:hypothetical protein GCM10007907_20290 [Chitinimonas prasina]|uniref:Uncharacterized protein n=1 Tax=Chitinimonas prasina TaxID=1434937 RepID=A0ABQ5YES4_9NEIS|nr:hypothetical protein [Chitinimonas prasina]GLR13239.1 hypothetical protein GCM10007907_20290 [Chitinimonas prasina]